MFQTHLIRTGSYRENRRRVYRTYVYMLGLVAFISLNPTGCIYGSEPGTVFAVDLQGPIYSSPIVADIDQDGLQEILVGSDSDYLYCLDPTGLIKWQFQTGDDVKSSPALGDIDGDGYLDVVFQSEDQFLYVLDHEGQLLSSGWPQSLGVSSGSYYKSTPSIADIDGDSELEIVTLSPKDNSGIPPYSSVLVQAFESDGSELWSWEWGSPLQSAGANNAVTSPAIADVDRDGVLDVVVYFGRSSSGYLSGVALFALRGTDGYPIYENPELMGSGFQTRSSPSLADLNKDGIMECAVSAFSDGLTELMILSIEDDTILWSAVSSGILDNYSLSSPVIGNINQDFYSEIIAGGRMIALDKDGEVLWNDYNVYSNNSSATLGDVDNDEEMEVFVATSSPKGMIYGFDGDGTSLPGFPLEADPDYTIESTPVLCDLDTDGTMDIVVGSTDGKLYRWETEYEYNELGMASAAFKDDIRRTGHYRPVVGIELSPDDVDLVPGETVEIEIKASNSSYPSQTVQFSLEAELPSGRVVPILTDYPPGGITLGGYETKSTVVRIPVPSRIPSGKDVLLTGKVYSMSGYTTDRDVTQSHIQ